jgi:hypothetical protein
VFHVIIGFTSVAEFKTSGASEMYDRNASAAISSPPSGE